MDYVSIDKNQFCLSSPARYAYFTNDSSVVAIKYKSLDKEPGNQEISTRGFNIYFESISDFCMFSNHKN